MRYLQPVKRLMLDGTQAFLSESLRRYLFPFPNVTSVGQHYPIFLMNGLFGCQTQQVFGRQIIDYYNGAETLLSGAGFTVVTAEVSPLLSPYERAEAFGVALDKALSKTGAKKVHIIAHDQAGLDARIMSARPMMSCKGLSGESIQGLGYADKIASITTLGTPHLGLPLADCLLNQQKPKAFRDVLDYLALMHFTSAKSIEATLSYLGRDYMLSTFNPSMQVPTHIPCYTVAAYPKPPVKLHSLLKKSAQTIEQIAAFDGGGENDGVVPVESAHFKANQTLLVSSGEKQWQALGDVQTDHLGLIGQLSKSKQSFNYMAFMLGLAQHATSQSAGGAAMTLAHNGTWTLAGISTEGNARSKAKYHQLLQAKKEPVR